MRAFLDSRWRWLHQKRADPLRELWRYGAALAIVAASTLVAEGFYRVFDTTRLSMVFLAGILVTAVTLGAWPAYFAAAISFFLYNFYLVEPRFTFQLVSAEDVLVLVVFAAVAFLTGSLTGRIRDQARQSADRAHTTAALFEASRELSAADEEDVIRGRIAQHIAQAARGEALVWDDGRTWCAPVGIKPPPDLLDELARIASASGGEHLVGPWRVRVLRADGALLGVAAWRGPVEQDVPPEDDPLVAVLADLGAAAVMRARLAAARSEIEAMARTEQLRNALLSSISHDLRTPLAAILASASSLKDFGERFTPDVRADLVTTIQEEAVRLNRFVANLLSMTRLESGALDLDRQTFGAAEVIDRVAVRFERPGQPIRRDLGDGGLLASGDPILLEQALGNVVENAIRYGPAGAAVTIRAWREGETVRVEVEDQGPGVPAADLDRIFEKFYRSPGAATIQGTGLGLSIARGLVEAMDGSIVARARTDGEPGLVVGLILTGSTPHAA